MEASNRLSEDARGDRIMYVCLCKGVTCRQIRERVRQGEARSLRDLSRSLGVATQCGKCGRCARALIDEESASCARDDPARQCA